MEKLNVELRVFVIPGGKLQIFVDKGTDEDAIAATKKVLARLKADGISFASIGEVEFHRDGGQHVHVVTEVQNEQR